MTRVVASTSAGVAFATLSWLLLPAPARLSVRLRPHLMPALARLGRTVANGGAPATVRRLLARPPSLDERLRHSGLWPGASEESRANRYRARLLVACALSATAAGAAGAALGAGTVDVLVMLVVGSAAAVAFARSKIDRAIRNRRERIRRELPTICQLLALWIQTGASVVSATAELVRRGTGEVVEEIADALRAHRAGVAASAALAAVAEASPERFAARCYRLLATAETRGTDVAAALLALADELRTDARERAKREATRRRAAMLLPIVAILAPTLLLFVAAPLPWIVFHGI